MITHLVTAGCSFSEWHWCWPHWLHQKLGLPVSHCDQGLASQGNGLISRRVIWQCQHLLQNIPANELLVVVMWSGPDRHDFYYRDNPGFTGNMHGWSQNPTNFVDRGEGGWVILNPHWQMERSQTWYSKFHDDVGAVIYTLEHMLRTQWYLKNAGISYVMTTYMGTVLPDWCQTHPDTAHLWQMLDRDNFLPVTGEYEWCRDHTTIDFLHDDLHPVPQHHQQFVDQVMWPFIKEKICIK
jgi:hypothetical protein